MRGWNRIKLETDVVAKETNLSWQANLAYPKSSQINPT
jgi:hypothetical protein